MKGEEGPVTPGTGTPYPVVQDVALNLRPGGRTRFLDRLLRLRHSYGERGTELEASRVGRIDYLDLVL